MNLTMLIFSRLFTNETILQFDPVVMPYFELLMIAIWGLAYITLQSEAHCLARAELGLREIFSGSPSVS